MRVDTPQVGLLQPDVVECYSKRSVRDKCVESCAGAWLPAILGRYRLSYRVLPFAIEELGDSYLEAAMLGVHSVSGLVEWSDIPGHSIATSAKQLWLPRPLDSLHQCIVVKPPAGWP